MGFITFKLPFIDFGKKPKKLLNSKQRKTFSYHFINIKVSTVKNAFNLKLIKLINFKFINSFKPLKKKKLNLML